MLSVFYSFSQWILIVVIFLVVNTFAQTEANNNPLDASYFAQSLTETIYNDTIKISPDKSVVILAEIGEKWFKVNPTQASIWFERAINTVALIPRDTSEEIAKKNQVIRELVKIILPKDRKNGNRLLKQLTDQSGLNKKETKLNNDALIETAASLIETDPNQAVALASLALISNDPVIEPMFVWKLNKTNPALANKFFARALQIAQKNNDLGFTNILITTLFPERFEMSGSRMTNATNLNLLKYVWSNFQQETLKIKQNKSGDCRAQGSVVSSILPQFLEFMPGNLSEIKNTINFCLGNSSEELKKYNTNEEQPKTVEQFISAAENAEHKDLKISYYLGGAKLAFREKNYELAIKVLDLAKNVLPDSLALLWEEWRYKWAALLIVEQIRNNNLPEAFQTLKNVPDNLKPLTQIDVIDLFKPNEHPEIAYDFLSNAAKEILKTDMVSAEKAYNLSQISKLSARYQMLESSVDAYRDSVKLINYAVKEGNEKNNDENIDSGSELIGFVDFTTFPITFVEENLLSFRELTNNIDSPLLKAKTKLNLLSVAINKLEQELNKTIVKK
jgi:hypothetical protein